MLSNRLAFISFCLVLCEPVAGQTAPPGPNTKGVMIGPQALNDAEHEPKIALVVGIDDYPSDSGFGKLNYAARDAGEISKKLVKLGYEVDTLTNIEAQGHEIVKHLGILLGRLKPGEGTVIFSFSGHGGQTDRGQFLAVPDSVASQLSETGVEIEKVLRTLEGSSAPRKMMFIDACRSNPNTRGPGGSMRSFDTLRQAKGIRILNAAERDKWSYEDPAFRHGVFTQYLLEGLKHPDSDGLITFNGVSVYVRNSMEAYSRQHHREQHPYEAGDFSGDFYIGGESKAEPVNGSPFLTVRKTVEVLDLASGAHCSLKSGDLLMSTATNDTKATVRVLHTGHGDCPPDAVVSVLASDLEGIRSSNQVSIEIRQVVSDEIRQMISDEIRQLQPPVPASGPDAPPPALDPRTRVFVVSSNLEVTTSAGACLLTPGDIILRTGDEVTNGKTTVSVLSSKPGDCAVNSSTELAVSALEEMHNQFRESIDSGLKELAGQQGEAQQAESEDRRRTLVVGKLLHAISQDDSPACSLAPGDVVQVSGRPAGAKVEKVTVLSSKPGHCAVNAVVSLKSADVQRMRPAETRH